MNWRKDVEAFKSEIKGVPSRITMESIRMGFFGPVGSGKSVTSGICAVGITPPGGLIGWLDGEGMRSGMAIDIVAEMAAAKYGGTKAEWVARFVVYHIAPPFNPLRVVAALELAEEQGCKTCIADIMTQCWDSEGGYLDMKETEIDRKTGGDDSKRASKAQSAAALIKPWTHTKLIHKVDSCRMNLVLVFQAKNKWNSRTSKVDEFSSPIQESGLTRLAVAVGRVECQMNHGVPQGGFCTFRGELNDGTKTTHPTLMRALPANGEQFTFEHAERVVKWATGETVAQPPAKKPVTELARLKKELVAVTVSVHLGDMKRLQQFLWDELLMDPEQSMGDLTESVLKAVIENAKGKLNK